MKTNLHSFTRKVAVEAGVNDDDDDDDDDNNNLRLLGLTSNCAINTVQQPPCRAALYTEVLMAVDWCCNCRRRIKPSSVVGCWCCCCSTCSLRKQVSRHLSVMDHSPLRTTWGTFPCLGLTDRYAVLSSDHLCSYLDCTSSSYMSKDHLTAIDWILLHRQHSWTQFIISGLEEALVIFVVNIYECCFN